MSTSDMKKAREWAERMGKIEGLMPGHHAAVEVIQSLPDTVVDGDKLREVINKVLANTIHGTVGHQVAEDYAALIGELIPAPSLPTLADMAPEERKACQWMQAELRINTVRSPMDCVIAAPGRCGGHVRVWHEDGGSMDVPANEVTPRPDLPRLEWPGSHADTITAESVEDVQAGRVADFKPALPCPDDVPAGEPWIVRYDGEEWAGVRADEDRGPWHIISMDGLDYQDVDDSEITLVSRLVPEDKP